MKTFYISKEVIANNFRFLYAKNDNNYKLYPSNDNILKYMNYATTYDNYYEFKEDRCYVNGCHVSKTKLSKNTEVISEIKVIDKNRVLFFEFPDDYPEEELFYFCMKYSAEEF